MNSDYPDLYPPAKPEIDKMERERIIWESEKAARELLEHRKNQKLEQPLVPSAPGLAQIDIEEILDVESQEEAEEPTLPLYEPHILARWFASMGKRIFAQKEFQIIEHSNARKTPEYSPKISPYAAGWRGLLGSKTNTNQLVEQGMRNASAAKLQEQGVTMIDFRTMKYAPVQLRNLFTSLEHLQSAGFSAEHMDSCCWRLGELAIAYSVDPRQLAKQFHLNAKRLLEVGVNPELLHEYDLTLDSTVQHMRLFDLAYMGNFSAAGLSKALHTSVESLFASSTQDINKLTRDQALILCYAMDGWNLQELRRCGMDTAAIGRVGLGLHIKSALVK